MGRRSRVLSEGRRRSRGDIVAVSRMQTEVTKYNKRLQVLSESYGIDSEIYQNAVAKIHNKLGMENMRVNNAGVWQIARPSSLVKQGFVAEDLENVQPMTKKKISEQYNIYYATYREEQRFFAKQELKDDIFGAEAFVKDMSDDELGMLDFDEFVVGLENLPKNLPILYSHYDNNEAIEAINVMHQPYKSYADLISVINVAGAL